MRALAFAALAAFTLAAPALASVKPTFVAKLATPLAEPKNNIVAASVVWACTGDTCTAKMDVKKPSARDCGQLAKEVGPLASFGTSDAQLDEAKLAQCNARAKK